MSIHFLPTLASNLSKVLGYYFIRSTEELPQIQDTEWASSDTLQSCFEAFFSDLVDLVHPDFGSTADKNIFSSHEQQQISAVAQLALELREIKSRNDSSKESFLKKPIVLFPNSSVPKVLDPTNGSLEGGSHWMALVILPKGFSGFAPWNGGIAQPPQVLLFDSIASGRTIPEVLKIALTEGTQVHYDSGDGTHTEHIPALVEEDCIFESFSSLNQQANSVDCGWWALYNASVALLTGNGSFYKRHFSVETTEAGKNQAGLFLRVYTKSLFEPSVVQDQSQPEPSVVQDQSQQEPSVIQEQSQQELSVIQEQSQQISNSSQNQSQSQSENQSHRNEASKRKAEGTIRYEELLSYKEVVFKKKVEKRKPNPVTIEQLAAQVLQLEEQVRTQALEIHHLNRLLYGFPSMGGGLKKVRITLSEDLPKASTTTTEVKRSPPSQPPKKKKNKKNASVQQTSLAQDQSGSQNMEIEQKRSTRFPNSPKKNRGKRSQRNKRRKRAAEAIPNKTQYFYVKKDFISQENSSQIELERQQKGRNQSEPSFRTPKN